MRQLKIQQGITNRGDAAIDKYLTEIGRLELLSMDEEVELAQRIRHGDEAALKTPGGSQFALCGFGGQTVPESRHVAQRPDRRGQHRLDESGSEI